MTPDILSISGDLPEIDLAPGDVLLREGGMPAMLYILVSGALLAANGHGLLDGNPAFTKLVAAGLADRLGYVTTYLADLTHQYGDAPGPTRAAHY